MSISKSEFLNTQETDSLDAKIVAFLQEHHDRAFTIIEIAEGIGLVSRKKHKLMNMLYGIVLMFTLSMTNRIQAKVIQNDIYYMLKPREEEKTIAGFA